MILTKLIPVLSTILGMGLGGVLIDFDHNGSIGCLWSGFWGLPYATECYTMTRGLFHEPIIMCGIIIFCVGVIIGIKITEE